jgi:DNA polymerase-3 subunit delta'
MSFAAVRGQDPAVQTLRRALRTGRAHHAYRFEGPDGVGKELAAVAYAQALLCEQGGEDACGQCRSCKRVLTASSEPPHLPQHPDLIFVQRGLYPPEALGRKEQEKTAISVDQVRKVVLERAGFGPHEGRALVFIIRQAEELTGAAANTLLKTLEEPIDKVRFVLLTSRPDQLLDTIRSRTLPVRFGPLPDKLLAELLQQRGLPTDSIPLALGSASLALKLSDPEALEERQGFVQSALQALAAGDLGEGMELLDTSVTERDALRQRLGYLAQHLALDSRLSLDTDGERAGRLARQYQLVLETLRNLERNANATLALEAMLLRLRSA